MTAQMLDVDHSVYVAPSVEAPRRHSPLDHSQAEPIARDDRTPSIHTRPAQVRSAEKLLIQLLVELCTSRSDEGHASPDPHADLAHYLGQCVPLLRKLAEGRQGGVTVTQELKAFFDAAHAILGTCRAELNHSLPIAQRQLLADLLGQTASAYWWSCERQGLSGLFNELPTDQILDMLELAEQFATNNRLYYAPRRPTPRYDDPNAVRMVQVPVALR